MATGQRSPQTTPTDREPAAEASPRPKTSARPQFDVFLSHNGADKPIVEDVARKLREEGLKPWLDRWYLVPGGEWQDDLPAALGASSACAVFIGQHGLGDWEQLELQVAQQRAAKDHTFRLIPVLLPGLPERFEPSTALPPFLATRTWVDLRKGIHDPVPWQRLVRAVEGAPIGPITESKPADGPPPYRGLERFEEQHADLFFGRDSDVQRLLEKLKASRFLAIVAPSGSGKSSLVRAGLLPALRTGGLPGSGTWPVRLMTPGASPLDELSAWLVDLCGGDDRLAAMRQNLAHVREDARALHLGVRLGLDAAPEGARVVLVVDQFEELFTRCRVESDRADFLTNLLYAATAPEGRCVVIVTLRADFYARCAAYPDLAQQLSAQQYLLSPMSHENLREVVEEPARSVGLEFEPGLVDTILGDIGQQPGALPLLEYALLELWRLRTDRQLRLSAYQEAGRVAGALAKRAEIVYADLNQEQRELARRVLLELIEPGEGTEDTRRQARMRELRALDRSSGAKNTDDVVEALAQGRLITTDRDERSGEETVDVAHETLIRHWPRLKAWIDEVREELLFRRRVSKAVTEWSRHAKDSSYLFRGARLREFEVHLDAHPQDWSDDDRAFEAASRAREAADARARSMSSWGELAGVAVGTGLAYGAAFAVLSLANASSMPELGLATAVTVFLLMFATNLFTGLGIGIRLRRWRRTFAGVLAVGLIGAELSALAYVVFWVILIGGTQLGLAQVASGACSGAGLGLGACLGRTRRERVVTITLGGVLGITLFSLIGGLSLAWPLVLAAGLVLGGLTALTFYVTSPGR